MNEAKKLMRRARRLYNSGMASVDRHNRRAWVRSVMWLGDKWLLAVPVRRSQT